MAEKELIQKKEKSQIFEGLKRYFFKNNFVLIFNGLALFSFFISLLNFLQVSLKMNFLNQIVYSFSGIVWVFLGVSLILSGILAYFDKKTLMFVPLMIWLLTITILVRTSNIPSLKNAATGEWTLGPDLDPYLFLRNAIEISENRNMGKLDLMRYSPIGATSYIHSSLMPWAILGIHKILSVLDSSVSITYAAIIAPVIFFVMSLLSFFFFVYVLFSFKLSKEKAMLGATIASFFYSFVPAMLHRTIAGIPELESLGMISFWLAFLFFTLAWKQEKTIKQILFGTLTGLFSGIMAWSWGGVRYIYMILGLVTVLAFLFNIKPKKNLMIFAPFVILGVLIESIKTPLGGIISSFSDYGFVLAVLLVILFNFILFHTKIKEIKFVKKMKETRLPENIISLIAAGILGIAALAILNPHLITHLFSETVSRLLKPFGEGRVGLTVAENRAPYFVEVLGSFGNLVWVFLAGIVLIFLESIKSFKPKNKIILGSTFIFFIITFVFSRIAPTSVLNGENIFSKIIYLGGLAIFGLALLAVYLFSSFKEDKKTLEDFRNVNIASLILLSFSFWAIVSMRGAVRLFFIIAPMIILVAIYFLIKIFDYKKTKDELMNLFLGLVILASVIVCFLVFFVYSSSTVSSASYVSPSAYNQQWQYAMSWVSNNTPENSVFVHWWDYGYWVQTLGNRPTVTDGGHYNSWWDHTTGRYLLTTTEPETALSLMKTHNVSYLLIDSSDLGKYGAYSSIGSGKDGVDRLAEIPTMINDPAQTQTLNETTIKVYQGTTFVDKDIVYEENNTKTFIPQGKAYVIGVVLKVIEKNSTIQFTEAPSVIFYYNGKQIALPVKYIYFNDQIVSFGEGIESIIQIIPSISVSGTNVQLDNTGAAIYLSEKVSKSLFAQLYLMNDPLKSYSTLKLTHSEDDFVVKSLKEQGVQLEDFVYYQGLRGPIKIWEVNYPEDIITRQEFIDIPADWNQANSHSWGLLDSLNFTA